MSKKENAYADGATDELRRQLSLMMTPEAQADVDRVVDTLGAFTRDKSGNIIRKEPKRKF